MIKFERFGDFCILLFTALATYNYMSDVMPCQDIDFNNDGSIILTFKKESARDAVYDILNHPVERG